MLIALALSLTPLRTSFIVLYFFPRALTLTSFQVTKKLLQERKRKQKRKKLITFVSEEGHELSDD
jgi:Kef-type K+ transport system membrane component KefB